MYTEQRLCTLYNNNLQKFPVSSASDVAPMLSSFRKAGIAAREDCWCVIMDSGMVCCTLWGSMLKLAFWGMSTKVSWVVKFCFLWDTDLAKNLFSFVLCDFELMHKFWSGKNFGEHWVSKFVPEIFIDNYIIEAKNFHFKMHVQEYSKQSCTILDPSGQRWRKNWWIYFRSNLTIHRCLHLYLSIASTSAGMSEGGGQLPP